MPEGWTPEGWRPEDSFVLIGSFSLPTEISLKLSGSISFGKKGAEIVNVSASRNSRPKYGYKAHENMQLNFATKQQIFSSLPL